MTLRIVGICFIFATVSIAWMILGATIGSRTHDSDSSLKTAVGQIWGAPQTQTAPTGHYFTETVQKEIQTRDGNELEVSRTVKTRHDAPLAGSDIHADLRLEHRRKGLLWYSTYTVRFLGAYSFENTSNAPRTIHFSFPFPASSAIYDDFALRLADAQGEREITTLDLRDGLIQEELHLEPGGRGVATVGYVSRGMDSWRYSFGTDVNQIRDFTLTMRTDFADIDFPEESIAPSEKNRHGQGWELAWRFTNLITGVDIAMAMPQKLNPGPWVRDITYFAPVSLFLFLFTMLVFTTVNRVKVHPMNYFFISSAFFAFHLLLAYLVDHISIHVAFWIAATVSIFLVISYMRLVVGARFAFITIGISQFVYLVVFSYTFFFKGYTGLSVTLLSIVTLFVVMQASAKVDWEEAFAKKGPCPRTGGRDFRFEPATEKPASGQGDGSG